MLLTLLLCGGRSEKESDIFPPIVNSITLLYSEEDFTAKKHQCNAAHYHIDTLIFSPQKHTHTQNKREASRYKKCQLTEATKMQCCLLNSSNDVAHIYSVTIKYEFGKNYYYYCCYTLNCH